MHAAYYKKKKTKNIVLWAYLAATGQTPTITAFVENDHCFYCTKWQPFWSRHVLLSGPKLQNTNYTDMFSAAVTRHDKQQTSGRLRTANNTTVKCFFKFMVSVSFHQSCPSFDGIRSIDNTSRQVLLSKESNISSDLHGNDSTNLLSLATYANSYLM